MRWCRSPFILQHGNRYDPEWNGKLVLLNEPERMFVISSIHPAEKEKGGGRDLSNRMRLIPMVVDPCFASNGSRDGDWTTWITLERCIIFSGPICVCVFCLSLAERRASIDFVTRFLPPPGLAVEARVRPRGHPGRSVFQLDAVPELVLSPRQH